MKFSCLSFHHCIRIFIRFKDIHKNGIWKAPLTRVTIMRVHGKFDANGIAINMNKESEWKQLLQVMKMLMW